MLEFLKVSKSYGKLKALDNISFELAKDNIAGLVGHNGAGKTTLFMIANGLLRPCSGDVIINNISLAANRKKIQTITALYTDKLQLYPTLTVKECLLYFLQVFGQGKKMYDELIELFKLSSFLNKKISELSTGMLKKAYLAVTLTNRPEILFLDEPFSGLDPEARNDLVQAIKEIKAQGKIQILISSHDLSELELVIDRLLVLQEGRLVANSTMNDLMTSYFGEKILIVDLHSNSKDEVDRLWLNLNNLNDAKLEQPKVLGKDLYRFKIKLEDYHFLTKALSEDIKVLSLSDYKPSLEDLYFKITKADVTSGVL